MYNHGGRGGPRGSTHTGIPQRNVHKGIILIRLIINVLCNGVSFFDTSSYRDTQAEGSVVGCALFRFVRCTTTVVVGGDQGGAPALEPIITSTKASCWGGVKARGRRLTRRGYAMVRNPLTTPDSATAWTGPPSAKVAGTMPCTGSWTEPFPPRPI